MNKEKPDYEIANEAAEALFNKLKITTTISEPFPEVRDGDWSCISYKVKFQCNTHTLYQEYHLGIGHVDWKKYKPMSCGMPGLTQSMENIIYTHQKPNFGGVAIKREFKKDEAAVATWLAKKQKLQPKPYEVFASVCREAQEASAETFESWASELGYSEDSRKAEKVFHACREPFGVLIAMIGSDNVKKFAELAAQF